jgi:hypothetical protein
MHTTVASINLTIFPDTTLTSSPVQKSKLQMGNNNLFTRSYSNKRFLNAPLNRLTSTEKFGISESIVVIQGLQNFYFIFSSI